MTRDRKLMGRPAETFSEAFRPRRRSRREAALEAAAIIVWMFIIVMMVWP